MQYKTFLIGALAICLALGLSYSQSSIGGNVIVHSIASMNCIANLPNPSIVSGTTYLNSNSSPLNIYSITNGNSVIYYGNSPTTMNQWSNISSANSARESSTFLMNPNYYFLYNYTGTTNIFHCQWIAATGGGSISNTPLLISLPNSTNNSDSMISLAFIAVLIVALAATFYAFVILEDDIKKKSDRPIYLLLIGFIAWFISIGFLVNPISASIVSQPYNVIIGTSTIQMPAITTVATSNTPFPTYTFLEYMAFALAMAILDVVFLILYMLRRSASEIGDTLEDMNSKK